MDPWLVEEGAAGCARHTRRAVAALDRVAGADSLVKGEYAEGVEEFYGLDGICAFAKTPLAARVGL